jgi:tetratricopeptide (TPR) repeat protein
MQNEELTGLIKGEIPFDRKTLSDLAEVIEEYPYFQTVHLLYTLNLQANKDTRLSAETRKTACYLSDRRKFFYLMKKDFFDPSRMQLLEEQKKTEQAASFDRIDFFLSEKEKENPGLASPVTHSLVSSDYISYFLSENTTDQGVTAAPMQHQDTIDKFISADERSEIKIVLKDKKEDSIEALPGLDTVEEGSFFSETLAKIYLKQKKYDKALEIIRKLNLIYPEKSIYFADQIRFLEKLVIHTNKTK